MPDISPEYQLSEAKELKALVDDLAVNDKRFMGLSRYIVNIRFFWSGHIQTACAGHGFIFFNPVFWDSLPPETRVTVLVHEVWHLILKHLERGKDCDPFIHNIAADHVINNALEEDGFTFEGTNPYKDPKYKGMSTEMVYNAIFQKKPEQRPKPTLEDMQKMVSAATVEDMISDILEADGQGKDLEDQKAENEEEVDKMTDLPGNITGNLGIQLELSNVKVAIIGATYEEIFHDYLIDPLGGGKRTFMRPNRRQAAINSNLRLAGRMKRRGHKNRLTHLVYALDVSGSITAKQAQQFHDSVRTIKELLNPEKLTVIFFDTKIKLIKTFTDKQPYGKINVRAGGGTSLTDVYKKTRELQPEALVIFTDLCVNIPPEPDWDTIWLIPDKRNNIPPNLYGDVYLIPDDQTKK